MRDFVHKAGCFTDAAMCRCRVPLSALLTLQGGSSNSSSTSSHWCCVAHPFIASLNLVRGGTMDEQEVFQFVVIFYLSFGFCFGAYKEMWLISFVCTCLSTSLLVASCLLRPMTVLAGEGQWLG